MTIEIEKLDAALLLVGEFITLKRGSDTVTLRALVRAIMPNEIVGTITQTDLRVIISPTEIAAAGWPGGTSVAPTTNITDARIPRATDKVIVKGKERQFKFVDPIHVAGNWSRCDMVVAG